MKTMTLLIVLTALSCPALAASVGAQTSQASTMNVNVDSYSYRLNALLSLTRTAQGVSVAVGPGNMFSVSQPAGPENGSNFYETFTIPQSVIDFFY